MAGSVFGGQVRPAAQPQELQVDISTHGQTATGSAVGNKHWIAVSMDITNREAGAISVELYLKAEPPNSKPILIPSDREPNPQMRLIPLGGQRQFLGHIINIGAQSTVSGAAVFMVFETNMKGVYKVANMQDFLMEIPRFLIVRDRVSGRTREYDVLSGTTIRSMLKHKS